MNQRPARIEITPFPQGKRIAVTTSFDDGHVHDRRIIETFNRLGLKGTFNLNSGSLGRTGIRPADDTRLIIDASEVAELYRGHEVAIHGVTHPWLDRLDPSQIAREVIDDRAALEDLVGYPVRGMAYPYGTYNQQVIEILRALGIVYSRTCENFERCFPPADPLAWGSTAHQYAEGPTVPERFAKLYANEHYSGVFFIWGHGFEFHDKKDWASLERIYAPLAGKPDCWYCTNIELFDYDAARQRMVIAANRATAYNPSAVPVTLKADNQLIDVPAGQTIQLG
jgi:peptidoglycan/xylan/chitin deacetylase (PgdA/CDA1 family)